MTASWLTVDLGNTRCKLSSWELSADGPVLGRGAELEGGERLAERLSDWLRGEPVSEGVALASVAAPALTARVRGVLDAASGRVVEAPDAGLENLCRAPAEVGVDRLFAARGALARLGRSCIVVDAGTALTVDVALARPGRPGAFLGGAIAPGPRLLASALARGAARLPAVEPRAGAPALGRDTNEAIQAGCAVGFRGAAAELVRCMRAAADLTAAPVVLTGGARAFLLEPGPFVAEELHVVPELVHLGLLLAARGGLPAAPPDPDATP